jgi:hypothetical protein
MDTSLSKEQRLARLLHEAGREAVEKGKIYRKELPSKPFAEWDQLDDDAREGRLMMARFVLQNAKVEFRV